MYTVNIIRESETLTLEVNDFDISKQPTDPSNVEAGRLIIRTYEINDPTELFYLTDITDIKQIEIIKEDKVIFSTTNFIKPREVRGYYEMAATTMATEIHFATVEE